MRTPVALLLGAALAALASPAQGEETPAKAPSADGATAAEPPQEPPYNPAEHGGLPYGLYVRATRGLGLQSAGMMVTGILLVGVGNVLMAVGTGVYATAGGCSFGGTPPPSPRGTPFCPDGTPVPSPAPGHATGMALLVAGTLTTAIGVPLWILGETPVRRAEAASLPTLRIGPRAVAVAWSF
jgi:hypothetical protein